MHLGRRAQYFLARNGTLIGLFVLILIFYFLNERFLSLNNARNIGEAVSALGVVSIPPPFSSSAGRSICRSARWRAWPASRRQTVMVATGSTLLGIGAGLGVGLVAGIINGVLVSYFRLNPIVVTLGALSVWGGLALQMNGGKTVAGLPESFVNLGLIRVFGIPLEILILAAVIVYGVWCSTRCPMAGCCSPSAATARPPSSWAFRSSGHSS